MFCAVPTSPLRRASFECLQNKWIKKVLEEAEQGCHICLVGTKLDLVQAGMATRAVAKEVRCCLRVFLGRELDCGLTD
jgi:GTPase SAR1 family protein